MPVVTFSAMIGDWASLRLDQFQAQARHPIEFRSIAWSHAWDELLSISLHNSAVDVSHIGNTWLGSLASMQSLYPFSAADIARIGGVNIFSPTTWATAYLPEYPEDRYAIPWALDTRIFIYRRDWLAKAGVDESKAFISHEALEQTLSRLQSAGYAHPWSVSTLRNTAHISAPWVWKNGGDFHSPDQHNLAITEPATLQGLYQFFGLFRYAPPVTSGQTIEEVSEQFRNEHIGVIYTSHHLLAQLLYTNPPRFGIENLGVAKVPGIPFVGGNSLVVWKHSLYTPIAVDLICHLLSPETQRNLSANAAHLPARAALLEQEPFCSQPLFKPVIESLQTGRAFHSSSHWGSIEKRLNVTLNQLWIDLFADPSLDLRAELDHRMTLFSKRIQKTFLNSP
jgi:multiple sugar transport system substrate-binding protein